MKLAVFGAGAWGTALALSQTGRHEVTLWARNPAQVEELRAAGENCRYLPGFPLPSSLRLTADVGEALAGAGLALAVVPTAGFRALLEAFAAAGPVPLLWACKGFESGSARLPHEVAAEVLGGRVPCGVLSGPSFAQEVARGLPTALTLASGDGAFAAAMAEALRAPRLRFYTSDDVAGVEVGGAVKNVMAIAAGISDGMGFGYNARAALVTRGLAEITRLGVALGGRMETFMGLTGMGDLILTCTGDLSRNRTVGLKLATGKTLADILAELGHVAEGVHTAGEVLALAERTGVDMPITRAVHAVLHGQLSPGAAVEALLGREQKAETPLSRA